MCVLGLGMSEVVWLSGGCRIRGLVALLLVCSLSLLSVIECFLLC